MGRRAFEPSARLLSMQLNRKTVEIQMYYGSGARLKDKGHNKIDFEMLVNISEEGLEPMFSPCNSIAKL